MKAAPVGDVPVQAAEALFRQALLESPAKPGFVGEVEASAAHYCHAMRKQGLSPELMLKTAKQVIHETIDGDHARAAERAISSCIKHYYGSDVQP